MIDMNQHIIFTENGPEIRDAASIQNDIESFLSKFALLTQMPLQSDSDWKMFKKTKKDIGNYIDYLRKFKKDFPKQIMEDINAQIDEFIDPLQKFYAFFDKSIKAYEESVGCGSFLANETRKANKQFKDEQLKAASLIISFQCETYEQKQKLIEYATSIGAVLL